MKKILSLCLVICLICMASVSASAAENLKICGESYSIFSSSISEAVATKNMRTGEVSFSNDVVEAQSEWGSLAANLSGSSTEAWFPNMNESHYTFGDEIVNPSSLIGKDNRIKVDNTEAMPYSAICYIEIDWPDGSTGMGTAFMIYDDLALTAGHCVYSSENGGC